MKSLKDEIELARRIEADLERAVGNDLVKSAGLWALTALVIVLAILLLAGR